jgi:hypothetical protein
MSDLTIERIGGLAGFGLPGSRIRSQGVKPASELSPSEHAAVEALFRGGAPGSPNVADGFRYRITRMTEAGPETVEAPESEVPEALKSAVRDELR